MEAILIPFPLEQSSRNLKPLNFSPAAAHGGFLNFPAPAVAFYSRRQRQRQQPPLLPSPHPSSRSKSVRTRDQSLTPKKPKANKRISVPPAVKSAVETTAELVIVDSTNRLGPDPNHVPKGLWKGLRLGSAAAAVCEGSKSLEMEFSGSAFSVSPPPSSVPLPKFPLMRKLAGVDVGATHNLCRLLGLGNV